MQLLFHFDEFPGRPAAAERFKAYIVGLAQDERLRSGGLSILRRDVGEVDSKRFLIMQCLDVVLGAMAWRLNDGHKHQVPGQRAIPKRTKAKLELYSRIRRYVTENIHDGFNAGDSTGPGRYSDGWAHPHRHWSFRPRDAIVDGTRYK